jgi:hypothetical protein
MRTEKDRKKVPTLGVKATMTAQKHKPVAKTFHKRDGPVKGKVLDVRGGKGGDFSDVTVTVGFEDGHVEAISWEELKHILCIPLESDGPAAAAASVAAAEGQAAAGDAAAAVASSSAAVARLREALLLEVDRDALLRFFETHDPEKLSTVDAVIGHYEGNAVGLRDALQEKFGASAQEANEVVRLKKPLTPWRPVTPFIAGADDADEAAATAAAGTDTTSAPAAAAAAATALEFVFNDGSGADPTRPDEPAPDEPEPLVEPLGDFLERRRERRGRRRQRWEGDPYKALQRNGDFGADRVRQIQGPVLIVRGWTHSMSRRELRKCYEKLLAELRRYAHKYQMVLWAGDLDQQDSYTSLLAKLLEETEFAHIKFVACKQVQWMGDLAKGYRASSETALEQGRGGQDGRGFDVGPEEVMLTHESEIYRDHDGGLSIRDEEGEPVPVATSVEVNGNRHFVPTRRLTVIGFEVSGQPLGHAKEGGVEVLPAGEQQALLMSAGLKFAKDRMGLTYATLMTIGEDDTTAALAEQLKERPFGYPSCKLIRLQTKREVVGGKVERSPTAAAMAGCT